eukprot:scaffold240_cov243-Pinguiococcus_pyrenoidosus.AAC.11
MGPLRESISKGDQGLMLRGIGHVMNLGIQAYGPPEDETAMGWPVHARSLLAEANFEVAAHMYDKGELRVAAKLAAQAQSLAKQNEVFAELQKQALERLASAIDDARKEKLKNLSKDDAT